MKFYQLLFISLLSFFALVWSQGPEVETVTEVDYFNATRYTGGRNIARTPTGEAVIVFEPAGGFTNMEIQYVTSSFFGGWDPPQQLSNSAFNATGTPAVIADDKGNIYAVWKEKNGETELRDIMIAKWTNAGLWSFPLIAHNLTGNNVGVSTVDISSDGTLFNMFSIWNDPAVFAANIYAGHSSDGGETWVTQNLTGQYPTPDILPFNWMDVNLAPGPEGIMYAVWEDKPEPDTKQYEVLFSTYSPASGWTDIPTIVTPINDGEAFTVWYADGCTPVEGADAVYLMGPDTYPLFGKAATIYYENGNSNILSSYFNPYYMAPATDRDQFVNDVANFFNASSETDTILVVDDDNSKNHQYIITDALDQAGIAYEVFDCGNSSGSAIVSPTADYMSGFSMTIWFTGDDGSDLALWNMADEDNAELKSYLQTAGSKFWIIGRDWIYDRYGGADSTFAAGEMIFDLIGISSYDAQSKTDDGGLGVSQFDLVTDNGLNVSTINPISWGNAGTRQGEPSVAGDTNGIMHLVYYDGADGEHIKYQTYDGSTWSSTTQLDNSADSVNVQRPNIALDADNGIYVIWLQADPDNNLLYNIFFSTTSDNGETWTTPEQLSKSTYVDGANFSIKNATLGKIARPKIDGSFAGGADVVWTEASDSSSLGYFIMYSRIPYVGINTGIADAEGDNNPYTFKVYNNYPNPFNPSTEIKYSIPAAGKIDLSVYNITGQRIFHEIVEKNNAGIQHWNINASNWASGAYFYRIQFGNKALSNKMVLLK